MNQTYLRNLVVQRGIVRSVLTVLNMVKVMVQKLFLWNKYRS
jgi:hypothetical protein